MIIHPQGYKYFEIDSQDDDYMVMLKNYYKNNDAVSRQILADEESERHQRFNRQYDKITKKNHLEDLKAHISVIDELLNQ